MYQMLTTNQTGKTLCFGLLEIVLLFSVASCQPIRLETSNPQLITGVTELDALIQIVLSGNQREIQAAVHFTELACTSADGLGGPPKCAEGEADGMLVAVLPILAQEGHYLRATEIDTLVLELTDLYAVYRVTQPPCADCPTGDYGLIFLETQDLAVHTITLFATAGSIVGIHVNLSVEPAAQVAALQAESHEILYRKPES